jgi:hypothetical protein
MALCTQKKSSDQTLEAMKWFFGQRHCRTITFMNDTDGDQDGKFFDLNVIQLHASDALNYTEKKYAVLISDGTTLVIPGLPAGTTQLTLTIAEDDTATQQATKFAAMLLAQSVKVRTEQTAGVVEVQNNFVGQITDEDTSDAAGLTFAVGAEGFGGYVGQTEPTEMTTTISSVVIVDDAQGETPLAEIMTGVGIELPLALKEMTTQRWKDLIGKITGNVITIDGKEVVGFGTKKIYQDLMAYAGRLVGHPVRNANTNIDEDIVILRTAPKFSDINFSGADVQVGKFTCTAYKDANAPEEINLMARGDHSKY